MAASHRKYAKTCQNYIVEKKENDKQKKLKTEDGGEKETSKQNTGFLGA